MSPREWRHRIGDILNAIEKIRGYVLGMGYEEFAEDSKTIDAVIRNLIVIGEAARRVPSEVTVRHSDIPWRLMGDMRNFAVHEYWGVDLRTVWEAVQSDLPPLPVQLRVVLDELGDD
jgi:uncharacterized protein with HEPN domain